MVSKFDFEFLFNSSGVYFEYREYLLLMSRLTTKRNVLLYLKIICFFSVLLVIYVTLSKFSLKFLTCINISVQFLDLNLVFKFLLKKQKIQWSLFQFKHLEALQFPR